MKTIFIAAALAITTISVNAKSNSADKQVTYQINESLNREFGDAQDIKWSAASNNLLRANFTSEGEKVNAFFNEDGEYVASTIELSKDKLPASLMAAIDKKFGNIVITEAVALQGTNDEAYFVKAKVNGVEKLLKGYSNGFVKEVSMQNAF